jgi:F0F1-type ATP synthase assembly protein I
LICSDCKLIIKNNLNFLKRTKKGQIKVDFLVAIIIFRLKIERGIMGLLNPNPKNKPRRDLRQFSLLAAVPALLIAGPAVGFLIGRWADEKLGSEPYLLIVGIILGFASAGREIYKLVKKAEAFDKETENDNENEKQF